MNTPIIPAGMDLPMMQAASRQVDGLVAAICKSALTANLPPHVVTAACLFVAGIASAKANISDAELDSISSQVLRKARSDVAMTNATAALGKAGIIKPGH